MTEQVAAADVTRPVPGLTFRGPSIRDPRLHVASVLLTVQVLGQVTLGFGLSIAQILVSLGTAAAIEVLITVRRTGVVAWPASALLTGNGVALILRVPGTEHGDWFSLRGWYVFAATAAVAVLSKYVIRRGDQPLFNPSNLGLVVTFLILGSGLADPQDLWWGPMSIGLAVTYVVIVGGGLVITRRLHLLVVSVAFWALFAALMALLALSGHTMSARWSLVPVEGFQYWITLALSPEILIFVFFMITDPRTIARGRVGGLLFGMSVAATSAVLVAFQSTEYATKVALLAGLVVVCAVRPLIERIAPAATADDLVGWLRGGTRRRVGLVACAAAVVALTVLGSWWASAQAPPSVAAPEGRPSIELTDAQRPSVRIGDGFDDVGAAMDDDAARRLADRVIENLLILDGAVETSDRELAATVATAAFGHQIVDRPPTTSPERTVSSAVVDVVRDPGDFQAVPRLSVTLTGTVDAAPWSTTLHVLTVGETVLIDREVTDS